MSARALEHVSKPAFAVSEFFCSSCQRCSHGQRSPPKTVVMATHYWCIIPMTTILSPITNICFHCGESWRKQHRFWSHSFQENEILQLLPLPVSKIRSSSEGEKIN